MEVSAAGNLQSESTYTQPWLRGLAWFFSVIFHPLFLPVYVVAFMAYVHPTLFAGFSERAKFFSVLITIVNMVAFPMITILLLKGLKFIDSAMLKTSRDRIIPYIACGVFFFWAYTVFKKQSLYPPELIAFVFGVFLAVSAALIANIYLKISMHAIGVGGVIANFAAMIFSGALTMMWPLALAILIAGIVCSSRLIVSDHTQLEIYLGLLVGALCQVAAYMIVV